jgi:hypothetical protein
MSLGRAKAASSEGQATVELVALLPLIAFLALLMWQLAVAGQAMWLAGSAARAAARAAAVGGSPRSAARGVLPGRQERDLRIRAGADGSLVLSLGVPLVTGGRRLTTVGAHARFAPQGD